MPSFLSRIAAMNSVSAAEFALDMGFSLKKIINLEKEAVRSLAECGGLTDWQMNELISWTGQRVGDVRMRFRGEIFVSRALRNPTIRGCPVCLRDNAGADPSHPLAHMALRGDWQLRENSLCVAHQHPLIPLWKHGLPTDRFDNSTRFAEILPDILEGQLEQALVTPSPYDLWLTGRLDTGADESWLADKSLYAATTFCKLLGTELESLHGIPGAGEAAVATQVHNVGFDVARRGEAEIRDALNALAARAGGQNDEPNKAFGQLYVDLNRAHVNKDDFDPFRKILRDCIVNKWPVAAGEEVLGIVQHDRKIHSVATAARETGIGATLLEQFLVHADAIPTNDPWASKRKTFDAKAYVDLLAEIPTLVGPLEMQRRMGATKCQLASLAEDKILSPRIDVPTIKSPWRVSDGIALVSELQALAISIMANDKRWEAIQQAKCRSNLSVGTIIDAIRARQLQIGRRSNRRGYAGFCVLRSEIDELKPIKQRQPVATMKSAAAFGRSIGIRSEGWFEKLSAAGHTPATRMPHPKWGGMRVYVSEGDISEFHRRFLTASTMEREFGLHKRSLLAKLKAAKVRAFAPSGQDFGALYLREEVEVVVKLALSGPKR